LDHLIRNKNKIWIIQFFETLSQSAHETELRIQGPGA
jgi:hypothetical protein